MDLVIRCAERIAHNLDEVRPRGGTTARVGGSHQVVGLAAGRAVRFGAGDAWVVESLRMAGTRVAALIDRVVVVE